MGINVGERERGGKGEWSVYLTGICEQWGIALKVLMIIRAIMGGDLDI